MGQPDLYTGVIVALILSFIAYLILSSAREEKKKSDREKWIEKENLPYELIDAKLFMSEEPVATENPVPLHGKVDQVFELIDGSLLVTDTKSRARHTVYKSDVIQLSVYRTILSNKTNRRVNSYGYVRTVVTSGGEESVRYNKVDLHTDQEIVELWERYKNLKSGAIESRCKCGKRFHK